MTGLFAGTVTFLFTDIEGSTELLRRLRGAYGGVLAEHQRILRDVFARHGGEEVDTQGDSFFVAFRHARDAVLAAVAAQRALGEHEWPEGTQLRIRIGVHTGQAAVDSGRYVGLAVHRTARISAAGHGGQVLVSQTTVNLLEDEEDLPGVQLRDLGSQRLKDFDRPVTLYQAVAAGLENDFPPLRTLDAPTPARGMTPLVASGDEAVAGRRGVLARVSRQPRRRLALPLWQRSPRWQCSAPSSHREVARTPAAASRPQPSPPGA